MKPTGRLARMLSALAVRLGMGVPNVHRQENHLQHLRRCMRTNGHPLICLAQASSVLPCPRCVVKLLCTQPSEQPYVRLHEPDFQHQWRFVCWLCDPAQLNERHVAAVPITMLVLLTEHGSRQFDDAFYQ